MKPWIASFTPFIIAIVLALSPLLFVHPVRVSGRSMEPTLGDGSMHCALRAWCAGPPREAKSGWWKHQMVPR